jgi:hypothetical protein
MEVAVKASVASPGNVVLNLDGTDRLEFLLLAVPCVRIYPIATWHLAFMQCRACKTFNSLMKYVLSTFSKKIPSPVKSLQAGMHVRIH